MNADHLLLLGGFWLVHLAAVASPGPSFVVVSRTAVSRSSGDAVAVAAGIAVGTFAWACAAWFGLTLLFSLVPALYGIARVAGAAFLLYVAFMMWRHADEPLAMAAPSAATGRWWAVRLGLWTQLATPKVAVFFGSVFAAVLPPDPSSATIAAVFAIVCLNEFGWYSLVALALSRPGVRRRYLAAKASIDRVTGTVLAGLGARLLLTD